MKGALRNLHAALAQARDKLVLRADQFAAYDLANGGESLRFLIHNPNYLHIYAKVTHIFLVSKIYFLFL